MTRALEGLLTLAAAAVGIAFFASVPYWPRERVENPLPSFVSALLTAPKQAPLLGPSVLASVKPAPPLNLELPDDMATVVARRGIDGETGIIPSAAAITTFRLRATGDLVYVAPSIGVDPVIPIAGDPDPAYRVRGFYAFAKTERGVTVIRWTERGVTYEIASRTLDPSQLAQVADKLR